MRHRDVVVDDLHPRVVNYKPFTFGSLPAFVVVFRSDFADVGKTESRDSRKVVVLIVLPNW